MDRTTLKHSPELDDAQRGLDPFTRALRRTTLAEEAWTAWKASGGTRSLADCQQDAIDGELERAAAAQARIEESRARIDQATYGPGGGRAGVLNPDDPDSLEAHGMHFRARELRRQYAQADHAARRRRVDTEVASQERLHGTLRRNFGADHADHWMGGGDAA